MSLHALAGHMAAKGRGPDSMLVHMTPDEVSTLHSMARAQGGELTINPDTGLPEAGFLSDAFKALAPVALGAVLGPAGFGLSAAMAGVATGGITALATGSLSRGLMAGMGAYGGAGLAESLTGAGTGAIAAGDIAAQQAAGTFPELAAGATQEQVAKYAADVGALRDTALSKAGEAGLGARVSAGLGQMASNPGAYAGDAMKYGLAAISPMMADKGVQTTTPQQDTGSIRKFSYDPYGQSYTPQGVFPAAGYTGMASGGIVALAEGGGLALPEGWGAAGGAYDDPAEKISYFNQQGVTPEQLLASNQGVQQSDIDWMQTQGYNPAYGQAVKDAYANIGRTGIGTDASNIDQEGFNFWTGALQRGDTTLADLNSAFGNVVNQRLTQTPDDAISDYVQSNLVNKYATDTSTAESFLGGTKGAGLYGNPLLDALSETALSGGARYALQNTNIGDVGNVEETYGGLKGLSSNINYWIAQHPRATLNDLQGEMRKWDLNEADIVRATGKTSAELFSGPITSVINPAAGAGGATGPAVQGGGTVVNPNGTITTSPRIPGIPVGGFTGMSDVRDTYTAGGGSTGYVNPAPKTMEEFEQRFNKQTGDSLAAYNYLMGKGAYPTKSGVGEIMRPYGEATLGIPAAEGRPTQKYIYDPTTRTYQENPNYVPVTYDSTGNRNVGMSSAEVLKGFKALPAGSDDTGIYDWVTENKITTAQLAAAMGISLAEAQKRMDAVKAKKKPVTASAASSDIYSGGFGDGATSGGGGAGAGAGAPGGGNAAGGAGNSGDGGTGDSATATGKRGGQVRRMALGGLGALAGGGAASQYNLGGYSDGGRLLRGPGDGVSDSIPATIGNKQPARLADGEFVVPARIVSELGNGSTEAGARKLYAMMDRVQKARSKTTGKSRVAADTRSEQHLPA